MSICNHNWFATKDSHFQLTEHDPGTINCLLAAERLCNSPMPPATCPVIICERLQACKPLDMQQRLCTMQPLEPWQSRHMNMLAPGIKEIIQGQSKAIIGPCSNEGTQYQMPWPDIRPSEKTG